MGGGEGVTTTAPRWWLQFRGRRLGSDPATLPARIVADRLPRVEIDRSATPTATAIVGAILCFRRGFERMAGNSSQFINKSTPHAGKT